MSTVIKTNLICCNGILPKKAQIYLSAAELVDADKGETLISFKSAIIAAMNLYDYEYDYEYDYDDYAYAYAYDYDYAYYYYHDYDDDDDDVHAYTHSQKVIALLFLAEIYS